MSDHEIPTLAEMTPRGVRVAEAYLEAGYMDGYAAGYAAAEREDAARWAWMRQHIRSIARTPDYATLAERRGQPERAARQRQILAEKGVA